jgi:hypothetical protein
LDLVMPMAASMQLSYLPANLRLWSQPLVEVEVAKTLAEYCHQNLEPS